MSEEFAESNRNTGPMFVGVGACAKDNGNLPMAQTGIDVHVIEARTELQSPTDHLISLVGTAIAQWKKDCGMEHVPDRLALKQAISILEGFDSLAGPL